MKTVDDILEFCEDHEQWQLKQWEISQQNLGSKAGPTIYHVASREAFCLVIDFIKAELDPRNPTQPHSADPETTGDKARE